MQCFVLGLYVLCLTSLTRSRRSITTKPTLKVWASIPIDAFGYLREKELSSARFLQRMVRRVKMVWRMAGAQMPCMKKSTTMRLRAPKRELALAISRMNPLGKI